MSEHDSGEYPGEVYVPRPIKLPSEYLKIVRYTGQHCKEMDNRAKLGRNREEFTSQESHELASRGSFCVNWCGCV